jgi:hypothetical protein
MATLISTGILKLVERPLASWNLASYHLFPGDNHHGKICATRDPFYGSRLARPEFFWIRLAGEHNFVDKSLGKVAGQSMSMVYAG